MSHRVFTVLTIGLALALLLVLGWRAFAPADPGAPPPARPDDDAASTASAALGGPNPAAAAEPLRAEGTVAALPQRRVRIVDEHGAPVADADVAFDLSDDLRGAWRPLDYDVELRLAQAPRIRTAGDGIAALPTDATSAFVFARAGDRLGHGTVEFDGQLWAVPELPIAPDRTLRINVVSPRGEPRANVPVVATFVDSDPLGNAPTSTRYLPRSDENGMAVLWHAQTLHFWDRASAAVDLSALVFGATPPTVRVVLAEPPRERIVLVCPDHGGVRVLATRGPRTPNRAAVRRWLRIDAGHDQAPADLLLPGATPAQWCWFPVALGGTFVAGTEAQPSEPFAGPLQHGAEVVVELGHAPAHARRATLLRPDGQPCVDEAIVVDPRNQAREATTDAAGSLEFVATDERVTLHAPRLHAEATVDVADALTENGTPDLGVVRLQPQTPLAQGRIVDAATRRPMSAFLQVWATPFEEGRPIAWAHAGVDGAFELWGIASGKLGLSAYKTGYAAVAREVDAGARDLVLEMTTRRRLRATLLVDAGIALEALDIRVRVAEDAAGWRTARIQRGRFQGLFELPDGDDLVLEVRGNDLAPVLSAVPMRDWIAEDSGFATHVDLRGKLANVLVAVRGGGEAEVDGSVYVRPQGSREPWSSVSLSRRFAFVAPNGTVFDAVTLPESGCCTRTTLQPGENTIDVPDQSVVVLDVTGLPPDLPRHMVGVQICRLSRAEPLLDALVGDGVEELDDGAAAAMPRTAEELENMANSFRQNYREGPLRLELPRRGSYVAVPGVEGPGGRVPLFDAAVRLEITTPGQVVGATIHLDPEKVRAALK